MATRTPRVAPLGVSKQDFNRSVRTLALVDAYKSSDYGDQFKSDQYTLFREALGRPAIRSWLGWSDSDSVARDAGNLDRLFNWMSQVDDTDDGDVDNTDVDTRQESSPVITTLGHVRELAKLIEDPIALKRLEETRSLQEATLSSDLLVKTEIERAFGDCDDGILKLNKRGWRAGLGRLGPCGASDRQAARYLLCTQATPCSVRRPDALATFQRKDAFAILNCSSECLPGNQRPCARGFRARQPHCGH